MLIDNLVSQCTAGTPTAVPQPVNCCSDSKVKPQQLSLLAIHQEPNVVHEASSVSNFVPSAAGIGVGAGASEFAGTYVEVPAAKVCNPSG